MNPLRLMASQVVLTEGELASAVRSRPCTIHGCRPISVSTHPDAAARNGKNVAATADQRNHLNFSSRRFQKRKAPTTATSATSEPRYAMPRMAQYVARAFGT